MIAKIKNEGFKFTDNNDLIDGQFTIVSKQIQENEYSSITSVRFSEVQNFKLFKKNADYDFLSLARRLKAAREINRGADELMIKDIEINITKQENGFEANMIIKLNEV